MTVTFFGHRRTPSAVRPWVKTLLNELIEKEGAADFKRLAEDAGKRVINIYEIVKGLY